MVGDISAADLKEVLNHWMNEGYAYTTVKKVYIVLNEYFRYLTQQDKEVQLYGGAEQGKPAHAGNGHGVHAGGNREVQSGGV